MGTGILYAVLSLNPVATQYDQACCDHQHGGDNKDHSRRQPWRGMYPVPLFKVVIRTHQVKKQQSEADALQKMLDERTHAGLKVTADTLGGPYRFFFGFSSGEKDARRLT